MFPVVFFGDASILTPHATKQIAQAGEPDQDNDNDHDHDPSAFYPSFQLDCLRQPYGAPSSPASGGAAGGSPTSTTMDDEDEDEDRRNHHTSLRSMGSDVDDDAHAPSPCPARLRMDDRDSGGRRRGGGGFAAALEEARGLGLGAGGIPETPLRRPGSGARSRVLERGMGAGRGDGSCSPVGGYAGRGRCGVGGGLDALLCCWGHRGRYHSMRRPQVWGLLPAYFHGLGILAQP